MISRRTSSVLTLILAVSIAGCTATQTQSSDTTTADTVRLASLDPDPVLIAEATDAPSAPKGATVAEEQAPTVREAEQATGISFEPRVWFAWVNPVDEDIINKEVYMMPMYGGTVTWSPTFMPNWSILGTILTGSGDGDIEVRIDETQYKGDSDSDRLDIELLFRYNVPDVNVFLFGGGRYIKWEETDKALGEKNELDSTSWAIEAGAGAWADLSEDGRHRLFGNLILGLLFSDWDWDSTYFEDESGDETELSFDTNFGYQFNISDNVGLSARYRAFILNQENDFGQEKLQIFHGFELTFAIRF
jgi:hypothetical protein